ncbi:MAG: ArnT family glycosyltransferase [Chloroflexota bacterium]
MAGQPDANNTQVIARLRALLAGVLRRNRRPTFGDTSHIVREVDASAPVPKTQLAMMFDQPETTSNPVVDTPTTPKHTESTPVPVADTPATVPTRSSVPNVGLAYPVVIDWWTIGFWVSVVLLVVMRFYRIDSIQSEMYGDIEIVQTYVKNVIKGNWPWYFNLSSGPLYHYLIAPVLIWLGTGYDQIKVASILVSLMILALTYLVARRLGGRELAMIALLVAGTGSWFLLFSRLGNSQIFVPLVTAGSLLAMLYYLQSNRIGWLYVSAIVAAMGLYSYPQSFVVAPVMWLTLVALWRTGVVKHRKDLWIYASTIIVGALPFVWMYIDNPELAAGSYVTEKIEEVDNIGGRLIEVIVRGMLAYFSMGDIVFRNNPSGVPHVDIIGSAFLVVGMIVWLRNPQLRQWAPLLFVPFLLLHVPSLLVLRYPDQVPSASRSIGVAPYAYLFIAYGLYSTYQWLAQRKQIVASVVLVALLGVSVQQNIDRYFVRYVSGLPYGDVPIGREIVRYAEMLSPKTLVYVVGCCWRDGTPEPFFSQIQMKQPERLQRFDPADTLTCAALANIQRPAVLIWSVDDPLPNMQVEACAEEFRPVLHTNRDGVPLFYSSALTGYEIPSVLMLSQNEADSTTNDIAPENVQPTQIPATSQPVLEPIGDVVTIDGITTEVMMSAIDTGSIADIFDNNYDSLARGANQNPMVVSLTMREPVTRSQLILELAGMRNFRVDVEITTPTDQIVLTQEYPNSTSDPKVTIDLPESTQVTAMTVTITEVDVPSDVKVYIHIREFALLN